MKNSNKILYLIFFVTVIPTVYVYAEYAIAEKNAYDKSIAKGDDYKATKQKGEFTLFFLIALGYAIGTIFIIAVPKNKIPYIVIIVGTIAIVILYYFRIYGIPIPGTDVIIRDISTDWRDVITKICQEIMIIPLTALLIRIRE